MELGGLAAVCPGWRILKGRDFEQSLQLQKLSAIEAKPECQIVIFHYVSDVVQVFNVIYGGAAIFL